MLETFDKWVQLSIGIKPQLTPLLKIYLISSRDVSSLFKCLLVVGKCIRVDLLKTQEN